MFIKFLIIQEPDDDYTFLNSHNLAVELGCSRDKNSAYDSKNIKPDSKIDLIETIPCNNWPVEIKQWFERTTVSGWRNEELKKEVIRKGCEILVHNNPIRCISYGSISFSKAEQILINSWSPVQQVVYHVVRVFYETKLQYKQLTIDGKISKYWLKTLMLWKCEQLPANYWNECNIITICCDLLREFKSKILYGNLIDYFIDYDLTEKLESIRENNSNENWKILNESMKILEQYCDRDVLSHWLHHLMLSVTGSIVERWML